MLSLSNFRNSLLTMANSFFFRRLVISKQNVYTEKGIQDISPTLILLKNDCFIPPIWLIQSVPVTTNIVGLNPVCQWQAPGRWFSPGTLVSSINKSYRHDTIEILLKVALSTINHMVNYPFCSYFVNYLFIFLLFLSTSLNTCSYFVNYLFIFLLFLNFFCL